MHRLRQDGEAFYVTHRKDFARTEISKEQLGDAINFAYKMVYGEGHHRSTRKGGTAERKDAEIFCNTFQGKLAEIILYTLLKARNIEVSGLDFSVNGIGIWDDCDLIANGKRISIKSAASFSNLLLLEEEDWNKNGVYKPDLSRGKKTAYDAFVLMRFKPDVKSLFRAESLFDSDKELTLTQLQNIIFKAPWYYDFAGYISASCFKNLISDKFIIPKNARLNGSVKMDAANYYCQAGDMPGLETFIEKIHNSR